MGGIEKYGIDPKHPDVKRMIERQEKLMKRVAAAEKRIASQ
jgi:hypothetical protein